jgi:hypothetical protein
MAAAADELDAAIIDWNTRVAGTGVELERVSAPCTSGPRCITVIADPDLASCGFALWDTPAADGQHTGGLVVKIHPN